VGVAAAALAVAAPRLPASGGWGVFALLAVAASLAQLAAVQLPRNRLFHPAIVFVVAGALLLTPQQLVLMCVVQHVPEWLKNRYPWYIQTFNIADYVVAASWASFAAKAVRHAALPAGGREAAVGIAAVTAFVAGNRILLLGMLRLARGLDVRASGLADADDVALELVLALVGVPFAVLLRHQPLLALLSLAPLVLIHVTQRAQHRLELASETIQQQNDRLATANQLVIERSTAALEALSATVDARDAYTAGHSRRVRDVAVAIGARLGLDAGACETLSQAALLHDIGKLAVPDTVLLKDGELDHSEWLLMRAHSEDGARIIERLGYLGDVVPAIRHHHERIDGAGYPAGLRGDEIPLLARIIHVADSVDAMLTRRVYREARTLSYALRELRDGSGTDFDPSCVDAFLELMRDDATGFGALLTRAA
jgi:putative nucleotidyltransferase with HDIG domain